MTVLMMRTILYSPVQYYMVLSYDPLKETYYIFPYFLSYSCEKNVLHTAPNTAFQTSFLLLFLFAVRSQTTTEVKEHK